MTVRLLHNVGYTPNNENYNTPEEINKAANAGDRLTFDGVYANVFAYADKLDLHGSILFVSGYQGQLNSFDVGMPREHFATWDQIIELCRLHGVTLGWHTWTHSNLTRMSDKALLAEITPPFPMKYFAYPYGAHNKRVREAVEAAGYEEAFSVTQGNNTQFQRLRAYL